MDTSAEEALQADVIHAQHLRTNFGRYYVPISLVSSLGLRSYNWRGPSPICGTISQIPVSHKLTSLLGYSSLASPRALLIEWESKEGGGDGAGKREGQLHRST
jgi:hypothetical protein